MAQWAVRKFSAHAGYDSDVSLVMCLESVGVCLQATRTENDLLRYAVTSCVVACGSRLHSTRTVLSMSWCLLLLLLWAVRSHGLTLRLRPIQIKCYWFGADDGGPMSLIEGLTAEDCLWARCDLPKVGWKLTLQTVVMRMGNYTKCNLERTLSSKKAWAAGGRSTVISHHSPSIKLASFTSPWA
jgi:hypothetical protein